LFPRLSGSDPSTGAVADAAEFRILLACLPPTFGSDDGRSLSELLSGKLDWDYLLSMAKWHGVLPFVAKHLVGNSAVPDDVIRSLRESLFAIASKNLRLTAELAAISATFQSRGIQHIPYKGTVLSQILYGTIAQRSISDIDLIVRPEDVAEARACLEELGFSDGFGLTSGQRLRAIRYGFEYSFIRDGVTVDLHWRLVQNFAWPSLNMDHVWRYLVPFAFFGRDYSVFSPELALAVLCVHSAQHEWLQLSMFVDLAVLLSQHRNLDWKTIEELAGDSHSRRSVLVALKLAHDYLGSPLPPRIEEAIEGDPQVGKIAERVRWMKWPSPEDPTPEHADLSWMLFRTRGEHFCHRWRYVTGVMLGLTMDDFWNVDLPGSLTALYFAIRPLRIALTRLRIIGARRNPAKHLE
jgi:hypothetical protein